MTAGARILVVEDEGFVAVDLQQVLVGLGYRVDHTAATADEALSMPFVQVSGPIAPLIRLIAPLITADEALSIACDGL